MPGGDGGRRAPGRATGDLRRVPRVAASARTRSSRWTSPSRTRRGSSCPTSSARSFAQRAPTRSSRRAACSCRGSSSRRSSGCPSCRRCPSPRSGCRRAAASSAPAARSSSTRLRVADGGLARARDERVQRRFDRFDPREDGLGDLDGADLLALEERRRDRTRSSATDRRASALLGVLEDLRDAEASVLDAAARWRGSPRCPRTAATASSRQTFAMLDGVRGRRDVVEVEGLDALGALEHGGRAARGTARSRPRSARGARGARRARPLHGRWP